MSDFANPEKAYAWIDGDAFRYQAGLPIPTDAYDAAPKDGMPFGGIEAGFELTSDQSVNKKMVFNYRQAAYKVLRQPLDEGMKFRAVDNSQATLLTRAQGGKITIKNGLPVLEKGDGEEFGLLVRLDDGNDKTAFYCSRCTLSAPATRAAIDGQTIDGWEFTITFLAPLQEILPGLPAEMTKTVTLPASTTSGTWTLTVDGKTTAALQYNADSAAINSELTTAGVTGVTVTGGAGGPYTILGATSVSADGTSLTGGTGSITVE